jgi:hypothetical protein
MICKQCGAEAPEGQLVCNCFYVEMAQEIERHAIDAFSRGLPLLVTHGTGHLLPRSGFMTLCGKKRYKTKPVGKDFYRAHPGFDAPSLENQPAYLCPGCKKALEAKLLPTSQTV